MIKFNDWLKIQEDGGTSTACVAVVPTRLFASPITRQFPNKRKKFKEWLNEEYPMQAAAPINTSTLTPSQQIPIQVPQPQVPKVNQPKVGMPLRNIMSVPKNAAAIARVSQSPNAPQNQQTIIALQQALD